MCIDCVDEEAEGIALLVGTPSGHREQTGGKQFPFFGLFTEANLSPLDGWGNATLSGIVGRFDSVMFAKGEQVVPVFEKSSGGPGNLRVGTELIGLQTSIDSRPKRDRFADEGLPVQMSVPGGVFDPSHGTNDVSPIDLAHALVIRVVRTILVRAEDAAEDLAQDCLEDFGPLEAASVNKAIEGATNTHSQIPFPMLFHPVWSTLRTGWRGGACLISLQQRSMAWEASSWILHTARTERAIPKTVFTIS